MKIIPFKPSLDKLIAEALLQKPSAQEGLYKLFSKKMLSVCRMYVKDVHLAEDVMVTGFVKVFNQLNNYQNKGSFEGWIRRIMINESISFLRTQKPVYFSDDVNLVHENYTTDVTDISVEDIQFLIDQLPEGYRIVFNLYAIEGYKHQEIADLLNITESTSKSQLSRARKILQENIKKLQNYEHKTNQY